MASVLALATVAPGQAAGSRTGDDFFAIELNDPLDYANAADRRNQGLDDQNITGSVTAGQYTFTTGSDAQIWLYFPSDVGAYPEEGTGGQIPIDANRYKVLTLKITCASCPDPNTQPGPAVANLTFYKGPAATANSSTTKPFFIHPGTLVYSFDLSAAALETAVNSVGAWTGTVRGLRLNLPSSPGRTLSIDWVTLTAPGTGTTSFNWQGVGSGTQAKVRLVDPVAGTLKLVKGLCLADNTCALALQRLELVDADGGSAKTVGQICGASPLSACPINTSMIAPGSYSLLGLNTVDAPLTLPQAIQINAVPLATVTQPDNRGDEAGDYARIYRQGDTWDFSQASDFTIPFATTPTQYGSASIVTNPTTTNFGSLSGTWMRYTNAGAEQPWDTQFLPTMVPPIDATRYRHLTIRMLLDRQRDKGCGAVLRVHWAPVKPVFDLNQLSTGDDVVVENGVQELHVDLAQLVVDPNSIGRTAWTNTGFVKYFRIDPHEYPITASAATPCPFNPGVTDSYFDYVLLTTNDKTVNGQFSIAWNASDADGDALGLTVKLDPDTNRSNGNEITLASGVSNSGSYSFDAASFPGLAGGSYNVLLVISDGVNTTYRYSTGPLDVSPVPVAADVPMYRAYNFTADYHFFTTSLAEKNNAVANGYRDESSPLPFRVPNTQVSGATALYRLYNTNNGRHYYTASLGERNFLMGVGWLYERDEGFVYTSPNTGRVECFRLYNNNSGAHLYSIDPAEKNAILAAFPGIWVQHTSVGYVVPPS